MVFGRFGIFWLISLIAVVWAVLDIVEQKKESGWKI